MILERGPKKEVAQISALLLRMNNLEEVTEENFCELATKDARMGNIVLGVYRCFIGDVYIDASLIYMLVQLLDNRIRILSSASPDASLLIFFLPLKKHSFGLLELLRSMVRLMLELMLVLMLTI